ncbi:predicted protein [Lichtheimia corymbifera JMRC:FSU:9682]|uniref:Uncharacterized protein n=1 Tax=Lichtheimia corymbifera JMRC:FSU:9682 TaxID=1263082 RepID=A0A068RGK7_9FUNG|nr:predicted protein [Lichtheimia corymbifera JMRC:FSU:9682]
MEKEAYEQQSLGRRSVNMLDLKWLLRMISIDAVMRIKVITCRVVSGNDGANTRIYRVGNLCLSFEPNNKKDYHCCCKSARYPCGWLGHFCFLIRTLLKNEISFINASNTSMGKYCIAPKVI